MRRTGILIALLLVVVAASLADSALAAGGTAPRGTLTSVEYREFLAVQKAEKQKPASSNLVVIARTECRALDNATRLTSTQHAECVASLFFFPQLFSLSPALVRCEKKPARTTALHCIERVTDALYRATRKFITTDRASARAARARGITGRCLDYLVFTPRQAKAMAALAPVLHRFDHALHAGDGVVLANTAKRLTAALSGTMKAFTVGGSVSACRHQ